MSSSNSALLTPRQAERVEESLRSSRDDLFSELLWNLRRLHDVSEPLRDMLSFARELEFVESRAPRLTQLGASLADTLTEYSYWKQRGRRHRGARELGALGVERLRGKRMLEGGCGAGVDLLSLQACADVVGVDANPLHVQFNGILARLEGLPTPTLLCAPAEQLPFEDESFDIALFHGSLPYTQIERALAETTRVLRPGGRAIAVQSDLWQTLGLRARQRRWALLSPRVLLREARLAAGMLTYPLLGRLLVEARAPVHASRRQIRRWLTRAGLRLNLHESGGTEAEVCYVAEKPLGRQRVPASSERVARRDTAALPRLRFAASEGRGGPGPR